MTTVRTVRVTLHVETSENITDAEIGERVAYFANGTGRVLEYPMRVWVVDAREARPMVTKSRNLGIVCTGCGETWEDRRYCLDETPGKSPGYWCCTGCGLPCGMTSKTGT